MVEQLVFDKTLQNYFLAIISNTGEPLNNYNFSNSLYALPSVANSTFSLNIQKHKLQIIHLVKTSFG